MRWQEVTSEKRSGELESGGGRREQQQVRLEGRADSLCRPRNTGRGT